MGQEVKMVTLKEASSRTGVSYGWLRKMCINGKIVHIRTGNKDLLNWDRLVDYLKCKPSVRRKGWYMDYHSGIPGVSICRQDCIPIAFWDIQISW